MSVFRRVRHVPYDSVNIAYIAVPEKEADELVKIEEVDKAARHEIRRVMYSDLAGRLRNLDGSDTVEIAYPVVTDLFYDKDKDKILDADEVVPEAAMPYFYSSKKLYYGPQIYLSGEFYREYEMGKGSGLSSSSSNNVFIDNSRDGSDPSYPAFAVNSLVGLTLKITGPQTSSYFDHKMLITANTGNEITVQRDINTNETDLDYSIIDESRSGNARYSISPSMNIKLVDRDDNEYKGSYIILVEPMYEPNVVVGEGTQDYPLSEHEGMTSYRVHVHLDRNDANLSLSFVSGEVEQGLESPRPKNIITNYKEKVNPTEYFKYFPVATVVDPLSEARRIVGSQVSRNGYYIYTTDRAEVDKRKIDQFSWRLKVELKETTSTSVIEKDELKLGIIGDIPDSLSTFLASDGSWNWRMTISNPHPLAGKGKEYWGINTQASNFDWSNYDVVILRSPQNISWNTWGNRLLEVTGALGIMERGYKGIIILDCTSPYTLVADRTDGTKLGLTTGTPQNVSTFYVCPWMLNIASGYELSNSDLVKASSFKSSASVAQCQSIDMSQIDASARERKILVSSQDKSIVYMAESMRDSVILSTMGFTNMSNDYQKQLFCNLVWGFGAQEPVSKAKSFNTQSTFFSPWETTWVAGEDEEGNPVLSEAELRENNFRKVEDPATGDIRYIKDLSSKTALQIALEIPEVRSFSRKQNLSTDNTTIYLELSGDDGSVSIGSEPGSPKTMKLNDKPEAWSLRKDSPVFNPHPGYKIERFFRTSSAGSFPVPPAAFDITGQIIGTKIDVDTYEFTWNTSQEFSYRGTDTKTRTVTTTNEIPIKHDSGFVDFVTTRADIDWTAHNVLRDKNPLSDTNLKSPSWWTTAVKSYPWDGRIVHLRSPGGRSRGTSSGNDVKYVQNALNYLRSINRGPTSGSVKVTGTYDWQTVVAVRSYQSRWGIKPVDGAVDAGTLGHIMRNANTRTSWSTLDSTYNKFGRMTNLIDNNWETIYGRRCWINASIPRLADQIMIYLKKPIKISRVRITPYLPFSGGAANMKIWRIGGRINSNKSRVEWGYDRSSNVNNGLTAYHNKHTDVNLNMKSDSDVLYLNLFQDHNAKDSSKVYAFRNIMFYGTQTVTRTVTDVVTWTKAASTTGTSFVKIRGGDIASYTISASVPAGTQFAGWKNSAATMITQIKNTIPSEIRAKIAVAVSISGNKLNINFKASSEQDDNEVMVGPEFGISVNPGDRYSFHKCSVDGKTTSSGVDGIIVDSSKDLEPDSLIGQSLRIVSGPLTNLNGTIISNTSNTITVEDAASKFGTIIPGTRYKVFIDGCVHYPDFGGKDDPDSAYEIFYRIRINNGSSRAEGVFVVLNEDLKTIKSVFSSLTLSHIERYGIDKIKIAAMNKSLIGPDRIGGVDQYPARYAMKPFCVVEGKGRNVISVDGLSGDQPNEMWGLKIEATTVSKDISIPKGFTVQYPDNSNYLFDEYNVLLSADGDDEQEIEAVYAVTSMVYSSIYGEPYIDMMGEKGLWVDESTIRIINTPMLEEEDGYIPINLSHATSAITPEEVDIEKGTIKFSADPPIEIGQPILVDYVYREKYIHYYGSSGTSTNIMTQANTSASTATLSAQGDCIAIPIDIPEKSGTIETVNISKLVHSGGQTLRVAISHGHMPGTEYAYEDVILSGSATKNDYDISLDLEPRAGRNWLIIYLHAISSGSVVIDCSENLPLYKQGVEKYFVSSGVESFKDDKCFDGNVVFRSRSDIFDLCPYQGHIIQIDGKTHDVGDLIGKTIYVFAMPTTLRYGSYEEGYSYLHATRSIYHTLNSGIFDELSNTYNPLAIKIATIVLEDASGETTSPMIIDTRSGGGGLVEEDVNKIRKLNSVKHYSGFNEIDSFYDIGHLDGEGYLIGGSVIIKIPSSWVTEWKSIGKTDEEIESMVNAFKNKWLPAAKSVHIEYKE